MSKTIDQQIADAEAKLSRLRERSRKIEDGKKYVLGGMLMKAAREDAEIRRWVLERAAQDVGRQEDKKRLKPFLDELASMDKQQENTNASDAAGQPEQVPGRPYGDERGGHAQNGGNRTPD